MSGKIYILIVILSLSLILESATSLGQAYRVGSDIRLDIQPPPYIQIIKQTGFETNFTYSWTKIDDYTYELMVCHNDFEKNKDIKLKAKDLSEYPIDTISGQKPNKLKLNLKNQQCDTIVHKFEKDQKLKFGEESTIIQLFEDNLTMAVTPEVVRCQYLNCKSDIIIENKADHAVTINLSEIHLDIDGDYYIYFYEMEEYEYETIRCLDEFCEQSEPITVIGLREVVRDARTYGEMTLNPSKTLSLIVEALLRSDNDVYKYDVALGYLGLEYEIDPYFITTNSSFNGGAFLNTYLNTTGFIQQNVTYANGTYISEIFDSGGTADWNTIQWFQGANYGARLPSGSIIESGDFVRKIDMDDNVLLLRMDNTGVNVIDDSGFGNNGVYNGSLQQQSGIFNYSVNFSDNSIILVPYDSTLNTPREVTFSGWFRTRKTGTIQTIYYRQNSYLFFFSVPTNMGVYVYVNGSWNNNRGALSYPTTNIIDNRWYHYAVSFNASEGILRLYLNGKFVNSMDLDTTTNMANPAVGYIIGYRTVGGNEYLKGNLDEFAIFNRTLSASEIRLLYERGATRFQTFARSCNDGLCSGETWNQITDESTASLSLTDNRYFQYKFAFYENQSNTTAQLWNVSVDYTLLPKEFNYIVPNFANNSIINLSTVANYFGAKFLSWNESSLAMQVFINGTSEQNLTMNNNTIDYFTISSINDTGIYTISISNKYNTTGTYYFTVTSSEARAIDKNINYIAIALIMIAVVAILAYIGRTSENELVKMFFSMLSILSLTGLSHIASIISRETLANEQISTMIFWFTVTFALVSMFMMFYTLIVVGVYILNLVNELRKAGSIKNLMMKRGGKDIDSPFE